MSAEGISAELMQALLALKTAARALRAAPRTMKDRVLELLAEKIAAHENEILAANALDLQNLAGDASEAFRDRLTLHPQRLNDMGISLRQVMELDDPVGEVAEARTLSNGLRVRRVRSPLGV